MYAYSRNYILRPMFMKIKNTPTFKYMLFFDEYLFSNQTIFYKYWVHITETAEKHLI